MAEVTRNRGARRPEDGAVELATMITDHVRANAHRWFVGTVDSVQFEGTEVRPQSTLFRVGIRSDSENETVLVKLARRSDLPTPSGGQDLATRPRLALPVESGEKFELEYRAMHAISRHFGRLNDPRYGAVRVFDSLPSYRGFAMESVDCPTLRDLALHGKAPKRNGMPEADLVECFRNAGGWLREFHAMELSAPHHDVIPDRRAFLDFALSLAGFVRARVGGSAILRAAEAALMRAVPRVFPEMLPKAVSHGDYAMRNVLVAPPSRVLVIDTLARHSAPIYRDVTYFLADVSWTTAYGLLRGRWVSRRRTRDYRSAFLNGYFGSAPVPHHVLQLFEIQMMLERWCSILVRQQGASSVKRRARQHVTTAYIERMLQQLLDQVPVRSTIAVQ